MMNEKQKEILLSLFREYREHDGQSKPGGMTFSEWYERRAKVAAEIKKRIDMFFSGQMALQEFKRAIDSANKRDDVWGFNGWKGMFFFNMIVIASDKFQQNLDSILKAGISLPKDDNQAIQKIKSFYEEVEKVASTYEDRRKGPIPKSTPYFLTYFWHIQNMESWPVQYPSTESAYEMLGLWTRTGNAVEDARSFLTVTREIHSLFKKASEQDVPLVDVGHTIYDYYLRQQESISKGEPASSVIAEELEKTGPLESQAVTGLPKSYIPPIVSNLPQLARLEEEVEGACRAEGQSAPIVFEQRVGIVFRLLGFDVEPLGQGHRAADVIVKNHEYHYAIVVDAKATRESYAIGTDSRKFIEYIKSEAPRLKKEGIEKIYFGVVSSAFLTAKDPAIREIKMQTNVHGVVMFRAEDLLLILDHRLRNPESFDLGPSGFLGLLVNDGVVAKEEIQRALVL